MKEKYDLVKLSDICEINIGKTPSRNKIEYWNGNHFWLSIGDMGKSKYIINTKEKITDEGAKLFNGKLVKPNTLLFSFKLSIGKVGIAEIPLYTNEAIASLPIKDKSKVDSIYLFYALQNLDLTGKTDRAVMGSTLNKRKLEQIKIPLPSIELQRRIAQILDKADEIIRKRKDAIALTEQLQKSIFIDMFGDPVTNPQGWEKNKLGKISNIQGGLQVTKKRESNPLEVPYLRVANVYRDSLNLNEIKTIYVTQQEIDRTLLKQGDILIVEGHGNNTEIGRSCVWDNSISNCVHQNHLIRVRVDDKIAESIYISNFLNSMGGRSQLIKLGKTTSGLNTISISNVKGIEILLPPINLQKKYVTFRQKIELQLQKQKKTLQESENLFNSLLQRAFKGEL
jgi:type I restriction enzyme S subunit